MLNHQLLERTISGLHDNLSRSLPTLNHDTPVLDIGCGTGAWLERLASLGFSQLHGIDLEIEQFSTKKATCSQANIDYDDLGLGSRKFGLITSIEVIEHLENPGRLFYHVAKHLDTNGFFLLTTPNIHSINCRLKFLITGKMASFDEKGDPTHIYPVLLHSLSRILARYSLEIVKQWSYPDKGSLIYRSKTQMISTILNLFLPNQVPGDTLCLLLQKNAS
ncbi:class I SAM-dependent methyltransferase [Tolypothrix sp. FACHB-123]|uniref:class I SAM-dependent methyltransferase n=1 Tax=Tolypothrix sp. FACHB-123 TaxID=2692868 RepID=UPI0016821733|nr:class I SAM-dependent methyltransferase [Tolypothrix sp. FACHB-123]MBD2358435.1 class I SAM-dependent methyltransferase [Tolypothrix sp. FACHB-123]